MFGSDVFDRRRQLFADQFEANGDGFLYRRNCKDAPIPVSAAERDRYIAGFDKFLKYSFWGTIAGTVVIFAALVFCIVEFDAEPPTFSIGAAFLVLVAIAVIGS